MTKDWREGNLTAVNCGDWRSEWDTGSFLLVSDKPCYQHSVTGKFAYFAMAEGKEDKYRIYVVYIGVDGSQDGFCSPYCDLIPEKNMTLVNRWEWAVKKFNEVYEECAETHRTLYPQYHAIASALS